MQKSYFVILAGLGVLYRSLHGFISALPFRTDTHLLQEMWAVWMLRRCRTDSINFLSNAIDTRCTGLKQTWFPRRACYELWDKVWNSPSRVHLIIASTFLLPQSFSIQNGVAVAEGRVRPRATPAHSGSLNLGNFRLWLLLLSCQLVA